MASNILNWLPTVDGQTLLSIVLGAALTIVTFWIGYRKTIGAQDERSKNANLDLCSSLIKRIAVERQPVNRKQFTHLRIAKSIKSTTQVSKLISFDDAISVVLLEVIDNEFLDSASKNNIIQILDASINDSSPFNESAIEITNDSRIPSTLLKISMVSISVGVSGYIILRTQLDPISMNEIGSIFSSILTGIVALAAAWIGLKEIIREMKIDYRSKGRKLQMINKVENEINNRKERS